MPLQTEYERLTAVYGIGKRGNHPNIFRQYHPDIRATRCWCEKCGWEQTVSDLELHSDAVKWTIPGHCYTYKERWEGKYEDD